MHAKGIYFTVSLSTQARELLLTKHYKNTRGYSVEGWSGGNGEAALNASLDSGTGDM